MLQWHMAHGIWDMGHGFTGNEWGLGSVYASIDYLRVKPCMSG